MDFDENETARYLSIPVFLVRDLVSYDFNGRKLISNTSDRPYSFELSELEEFGRHLWSKWPEGKRDIPKPIERYVMFEANGICALCKQHQNHYDFAHIKPWVKYRCHHPHNILYLCITCHRSYGDNVKLLEMTKEERLTVLTGTQSEIVYQCDMDMHVGAAVYVLNGQARLAQANQYGQKAIGFISRKLGAERCIVQRVGPLAAFDNLVPGKHYHLSIDSPGKIECENLIPTRFSPELKWYQQLVGVAESESTLGLNIQSFVFDKTIF